MFNEELIEILYLPEAIAAAMGDGEAAREVSGARQRVDLTALGVDHGMERGDEAGQRHEAEDGAAAGAVDGCGHAHERRGRAQVARHPALHHEYIY